MTAFDYVVLTVLVASIALGLVRGLVKEVLSLAAWIVAFVVANRYGPDMAELLPAALVGVVVRLVVGFVVLFIGTLLLASLVNRAIAHIIAAAGLKPVDRGLGSLFGLARGLLIVLTAVILAGMTDLPRQAVWRDALLSDATENAVRLVKPWLPDDWARHVNY